MRAHFFLLLVAACSSTTTVVANNPDAGGDPGGQPADDAGTPETGAGTQCSKARDDLLVPIKKVSTGKVTVVSDTGGVKTLYIDATAGGTGSSSKNPHIYVNLESGTRVDVDDVAAYDSTDWDLSFRRPVIWTNSGDSGKGIGGGVGLVKAFASVTAADADKATIVAERFFDDNCEAQKDQTGSPFTTFSLPEPYGWYDYDQATMIPTARTDVTYIVKGGTGKRYKVGITSYVGKEDGTEGTTTGAFLIKVAPL